MGSIAEALGSSIQAGRLSLPVWLIAGALFFGLGSAAALFLFAKRPRLRKETRDIVGNALIFGLIGWKISPILSSFSTVIRDPVTLLYLPGGMLGVGIGAVVAAAYVGIKISGKGVPALIFLKPLLVHLVAGAVAVIIVAMSISIFRASGDGSLTSSRAPQFTLVSLDGVRDGYSEEDNSIVVINFWASWCPPCRAEIPELIQFADELDPSTTKLLSVNLTASEPGIDAVAAFAESFEINYIVLLDKGNVVANKYGVRALPTTVIINADGTIKSIRSGAVSRAWLRGQTK